MGRTSNLICAGCTQSLPNAPLQCPYCEVNPLVADRFQLVEVVEEYDATRIYRAVEFGSGAVLRVRSHHAPAHTMSHSVRFERDVRVLAQLNHPAIPRYLGHAEFYHEDIHRTYVVEGIEPGTSLAAESAHRRYTEFEVLRLLSELATVVQYLHDLNPTVVHRDLTLHNIVRSPKGRLSVTNFSTAYEGVGEEDFDVDDLFQGTFGYMAPEQYIGDVCVQSDIYAMGVVAVALLSHSDPEDLLDADLALQWRGVVDVSPATVRLLEHVLQEHPEHRPQSSAELQAILGRLTGEYDLPPVQPPQSQRRLPAPSQAPPTSAPRPSPANTRARAAFDAEFEALQAARAARDANTNRQQQDKFDAELLQSKPPHVGAPDETTTRQPETSAEWSEFDRRLTDESQAETLSESESEFDEQLQTRHRKRVNESFGQALRSAQKARLETEFDAKIEEQRLDRLTKEEHKQRDDLAAFDSLLKGQRKALLTLRFDAQFRAMRMQRAREEFDRRMKAKGKKQPS